MYTKLQFTIYIRELLLIHYDRLRKVQYISDWVELIKYEFNRFSTSSGTLIKAVLVRVECIRES